MAPAPTEPREGKQLGAGAKTVDQHSTNDSSQKTVTPSHGGTVDAAAEARQSRPTGRQDSERSNVERVDPSHPPDLPPLSPESVLRAGPTDNAQGKGLALPREENPSTQPPPSRSLGSNRVDARARAFPAGAAGDPNRPPPRFDDPVWVHLGQRWVPGRCRAVWCDIASHSARYLIHCSEGHELPWPIERLRW